MCIHVLDTCVVYMYTDVCARLNIGVGHRDTRAKAFLVCDDTADDLAFEPEDLEAQRLIIPQRLIRTTLAMLNSIEL